MRRTLLILVVTTSLFNSGLLEPIGNLLASLWGSSATGDAGCIWDPSGRCLPDPEPQTDEGCGWDPYGLTCSQGS